LQFTHTAIASPFSHIRTVSTLLHLRRLHARHMQHRHCSANYAWVPQQRAGASPLVSPAPPPNHAVRHVAGRLAILGSSRFVDVVQRSRPRRPQDMQRRRYHCHSTLQLVSPHMLIAQPMPQCPGYCRVFRASHAHCSAGVPPPLPHIRASFMFWCFIMLRASCLRGSCRRATRITCSHPHPALQLHSVPTCLPSCCMTLPCEHTSRLQYWTVAHHISSSRHDRSATCSDDRRAGVSEVCHGSRELLGLCDFLVVQLVGAVVTYCEQMVLQVVQWWQAMFGQAGECYVGR